MKGVLVDEELVMQVRSGGPDGGADVDNQLALTDRVAFFQAGGEPALMSVQRAVAAIVLQNNGVAVAILAAFELDDAVGGCVDGRAGGCCIVDEIGRASCRERVCQYV